MTINNGKLKEVYLGLKKKMPGIDAKTLGIVSGFIVSQFSDFDVNRDLNIEALGEPVTGYKLELADGSKITCYSNKQLLATYEKNDNNNDSILIEFVQTDPKLSSITAICTVDCNGFQYEVREDENKDGSCLIMSESFPNGENIEFFITRNTNIDDVEPEKIGSGMIYRMPHLLAITGRAFLLCDNCKKAFVKSPLYNAKGCRRARTPDSIS